MLPIKTDNAEREGQMTRKQPLHIFLSSPARCYLCMARLISLGPVRRRGTEATAFLAHRSFSLWHFQDLGFLLETLERYPPLTIPRLAGSALWLGRRQAGCERGCLWFSGRAAAFSPWLNGYLASRKILPLPGTVHSCCQMEWVEMLGTGSIQKRHVLFLS